MFKVMTVGELAEDAFLKTERVKALEMMNTPSSFDDRKKAFMELAVARADANEATSRLVAVTKMNGDAVK